MQTRQTVVVSGAGGFLGRHLAEGLFASGHRVVGCVTPESTSIPTCGLRLYRSRFPDPSFKSLVASEQPNWFIHCAGSSSVAASMHDPVADHRANVDVTHDLYRALAEASPKTRIVFLSSAAVYGQPDRLPIDEQTPVDPISPYGRHKYQCEQLGREFHSNYGTRITNLRVFSAYGSRLKKQILWDLYRKSKHSSTIMLDGTGEETRDFIHVQDIVNVVGKIVTGEVEAPTVLNVASGTSTSIRSLAERFLEHSSHTGELVFSGRRSQGVPEQWAVDTAQMQRLFGPIQIDLNVGLREYVDWLRYREGGDDANRVLAAAG